MSMLYMPVPPTNEMCSETNLKYITRSYLQKIQVKQMPDHETTEYAWYLTKP